MEVGKMELFILNSPILPDFGEYEFKKISVEEAKNLASSTYNFTSAVGHQGTAELLSTLLGVEIKFNRIKITMAPGDRAIVFKLNTRLPEGRVLSKEELAELDYEFGLLERKN